MKPVTGLARGAGVRRGRRAGAGRVPGRTVAPPHASSSSSSSSNAAVVVPGDTVLVAGATGGVGQILTKKLVEVRSTFPHRDMAIADTLFSPPFPFTSRAADRGATSFEPCHGAFPKALSSWAPTRT